MKKDISVSLKTSRILAIVTVILGLALLTYMVKFEDEPGAIPLFLIVAGTLWFFFNRNSIRKYIVKNS